MNSTITPLAGLKVLDFSTLLPGPFASHLLCDLGAEVLCVAAPGRPDLLRLMQPKVGSSSAAQATLHRGKRSIEIDLKDPRSHLAIMGLLADYDIVLESFRPGVMKRLGLDYETLKSQHPRLIYCSLTGYGQTGPLAHRAGHDINYLAVAGALSYSGGAQPGPVLSGVQMADMAGALYAVSGILAAVVHRQQCGEGQHVDISITDAAFSLNALMAPGVLAGSAPPAPNSTALNGGGLYDFYRTADGHWLSVGSLEPAFSQALIVALGLECRPLASNSALDSAELKREIALAIAARDRAHWLQVFAATDACVELVLSLDEAAKHPQIVARDMVIEVTGPDGLPLRQVGCAIKFSRPLPRPRWCGGPADAHNAEVLGTPSFQST